MMNKLQNMLSKEFDETSSHKLRGGPDISIGFVYQNFLMDEHLDKGGKPVNRYWGE